MDALAAILTPEFGRSEWTDHEVGVALGRGKLVLPIRYAIDPYGLIAKYQGFQSKGRTVGEVAHAVFKAIMENTRTSARLLSCLTEQFTTADSVESALAKLELIEQAPEISAEIMSSIRERASAFSTKRLDDARYMESVSRFLLRNGTEPVQRTEKSSDDMPF